MDPFAQLKDDHERIKSLLSRLAETTERGVKTRRDLFDQIRAGLAQHETIEEEILYPTLREHRRAEELVLEAYEEHDVVDRLLSDLAGMDVSDERWGARAKVMQENIEHHIDEEEGELFKRARQVLDKDELDELAARMAERRRELERGARISA